MGQDYYNARANIGLMYIYKNKFDSAVIYLNEGLAYFNSVADNYGLGQSYCDLGSLYLKTNQTDSAIKFFTLSDRYANILNDKKLLATNGYHLGELYYKIGNLTDAKSQFENIRDMAIRSDFLKLQTDSYFYLAKIDSINQDFKGALEKYQIGEGLHDSINSISVQKQIAELEIQYGSLQKDQEISLLKKDNELQNLKMKRHLGQRNTLVVFSVLVILIVAFVFYGRRKIRITNKLLANQNEEIAKKNAILVRHEEQLEQMVKERTAELMKAKEKAEESDRLKSAFLANMSHEIRTPLNGILGFMELLEDKEISSEDHENYYQIIRKSSDRLLETINNIINFSKIESGQMKVLLSDFDFAERAHYWIDFFIPEAIKKGIHLHESPKLQSTTFIIRSDQNKIEAILSNLIKNAIKYTNNGSIEIGYEFYDGFLHFYVKDTGIGIPAERLESVFDRFIQVNDNLNRSLEGSGLGLAIAKAYVEMLGGSIEVESVVKRGTTFRIKIPV
jgi:signal transduction histidine kinase